MTQQQTQNDDDGNVDDARNWPNCRGSLIRLSLIFIVTLNLLGLSFFLVYTCCISICPLIILFPHQLYWYYVFN